MSPVETLEPDTLETYDQAADRVYSAQRLEDYMESTEQTQQRFITLQSFLAIALIFPKLQCLNDLVILYRMANKKRLQHVAPDNLVVITDVPLGALRSFNLEQQSAKPMLVMEYISKGKGGRKKDLKTVFKKYQDHLRIPYYLIFDPETKELWLYRLVDGRYVEVEAGDNGLRPMPELNLGVGLVNGWVRFWLQGELVRLMENVIHGEAEEKKARLKERKAREAAEAAFTKAKLEAAEKLAAADAEIARLKGELERAKGSW